MFGFSGSVYKNWCPNALKLSYLHNLCIFTAGTQHVGLTKGDQTIVAYISVGIAFITFVAIVAYHVYLCNKTCKSQHAFCCTKMKLVRNTMQIEMKGMKFIWITDPRLIQRQQLLISMVMIKSHGINLPFFVVVLLLANLGSVMPLKYIFDTLFRVIAQYPSPCTGEGVSNHLLATC